MVNEVNAKCCCYGNTIWQLWKRILVAMVTYIIGEGISRVGDTLIANAVLISTLFQRP